MAWCYVLKQITAKNGLDNLAVTGAVVVFHVGIPADVNEVDVSYRDAVLESPNPVPSVVRDLETRFGAQYAKLQSGGVIEIVEKVDYNAMNLTVDQRRAIIAGRASTIESEVVDILKIEYDLSGLEIDD